MSIKEKIALGIVLLAITASITAYAQMPDMITGQRVDYDQRTGNSLIHSPRIISQDGVVVTADTAQYTVDENEVPRVMDLAGNVRVQFDDKVAKAQRAVYYPELQLLSAQKVSVSSLVSPAAVVTYTCSAGTLSADGTPVAGNSACFGFTQISCGGSGGNSVQVVKLKYSCGGG